MRNQRPLALLSVVAVLALVAAAWSARPTSGDRADRLADDPGMPDPFPEGDGRQIRRGGAEHADRGRHLVALAEVPGHAHLDRDAVGGGESVGRARR